MGQAKNFEQLRKQFGFRHHQMLDILAEIDEGILNKEYDPDKVADEIIKRYKTQIAIHQANIEVLEKEIADIESRRGK